MVAKRHGVAARPQNLLVDCFRQPEPPGRILGIGHDGIEAPGLAQPRELLSHHGAAAASDDIAEEEKAHQTRPGTMRPASVAMASRGTSCCSSGTAATSWQAKAK